MLRSARRYEFFEKLQALVLEIPVIRFPGDEARPREQHEWLMPSGHEIEIEIERLKAAYEVQTDADKELIAPEWYRFLDTLTRMRIGSKEARQIASRIAQLLDAPAADESDLSLSEQVLQSLPHIEAALASPAGPGTAPVAASEKEDDNLFSGMEVYMGSPRVRRWQIATGALLVACVGLLAYISVVGHLDYVAVTERLPLTEIPILEAETVEVSTEELSSASDTLPTVATIPGGNLPLGGESSATGGTSTPLMPKQATRASEKNRKRVKLQRRVTAAGSIDTIVIEPPARTGQTPISVTIKPYAPRRIDTTLDTARRIIVPDIADLLHLDVTVPSATLAPTGKGKKRATMNFQWREAYTGHLKEEGE